LRGSAALKPSKTALSILLLAAAALTAGRIRGEPVLSLLGAIFLAVSGYCFLAVLFLALAHRNKAPALSARITGGALRPGAAAGVFVAREPAAPFFRLPALLVRYEINLATKDGRAARYVFDPDAPQTGGASFPAPERGAYYGAGDRLIVADALGLFRWSFRAGEEAGGPRLLVAPRLPEEAPFVPPRSGGTRRREERFRRAGGLTEHRPYVPGDDPRRINWKLYGHAGGLFVREGEREPPPRSRLIILVDTQVDPALFNPEAGRRGVDLLCENACALALDYRGGGREALTGYTGGALREGADPAALAWPAALPLGSGAEFPPLPEGRGLLILALPRTAGKPGALDRCLESRPPGEKTDLAFLCPEAALKGPAETCAARYGQFPKVRAWAAAFNGGSRGLRPTAGGPRGAEPPAFQTAPTTPPGSRPPQIPPTREAGPR
jgi:hypothetical protein